MSSICKRIAKPKKVIARKRRQQRREWCSKKYRTFNILNNEGKNVVVKFDTPKTCVEVHSIYSQALGIEGIE